ncbi:hypothetical protein [Streptomyces sp. NPDC093261]|uniref:hypothetical protein n=1 Tax=Streptomyces sp. NPDC093261 TaxID=3366037 RepID=UPI0037FD2E7A
MRRHVPCSGGPRVALTGGPFRMGDPTHGVVRDTVPGAAAGPRTRTRVNLLRLPYGEQLPYAAT